MSGILYVVATPIGNLEDVTLRALRILRDVSLIAAEDTRRTGRLLQHYSISTRTTSLHEHNERAKAERLVQRLIGGESIAVVSDAGTPAISDPGGALVAAARTAGVRVEAVPGPSAVMTALAASGFSAAEFTFLGFPPTRSKDRAAWIAQAVRQPRLVIFFEAPHRIRSTFEALLARGGDRTIAIGRELTKVHEELVVCQISEAIERFSEPRGEFTLLLPPTAATDPDLRTTPDADQLALELGVLTASGVGSKREALKVLADRHGLGVNEIYRILQEQSSE